MNAVLSELKSTLWDFEPDLHCSDPYPWGTGYLELSDADREALPPASIFLAFVKFAGFPYLGHDEKIKWTIPVLFRGIPFVLMHAKFGFSISALDGERATQHITRELVGRLRHAVRITDALIQPFAAEQVRNGNVTVENRYVLFRRMYEFLRGKARDGYSSPPPAREAILDKDGNPVGWHCKPFQAEFEGFFLAAPALNSYYSLLEHLLVLLLPFANFDPSKDDLVAFSTDPWGRKFKRVFDITNNPASKQVFDSLLGLKDRLRNPLAHGGFEDGGKHALNFHVPDLGAVPLSVSRFRRSIHYSIVPIPPSSFHEVCQVLDAVDSFLEKGPLRLGFMYARWGLDVAFDAHSLAEYAQAASSEEEMEEFIEHTPWQHDQAANMDW